MWDFINIVAIIITYLLGYFVSLYALAVYVDPDEIETLTPKVSRSKRIFLEKLADDPRALYQIAEVYKYFSLILITVLTIKILSRLSLAAGGHSLLIHVCGLFLTWLLYIFIFEIMPRYSSRDAINVGMIRHLWLINLIYYVFLPIVHLYRYALKRSQSDQQVSEEDKEEIVERAIATVAENSGIGENIVDDEEREMISQIFLLDQTVVREIMLPRINMVAIEKSMTFKEIREIVVRDGHSRYPVYEENVDKIIGMIYVKDLFNNLPEPGEKFTLTKYLRKPYFVPENKVIGDLLREFKDKHQHIALVIDEYGGIAGLVTLEDIIEEIFGEIQDEHDYEEADIKRMGEGRYLVDTNIMVEKLQDYLETDYDQEDYDTVGGLIYDLVGSVPNKGQIIKWHDLEFMVDKVEGQRIITVVVTYRGAPS